MTILIPYCPKDEHQALDLLNWIAEMGQVDARCFLLGRTLSPEMQSAAQRAFTTTGFIHDAEAIDSNWKDSWDEKKLNSAEGANSLFKQAGMFFYGLHVQGKGGPWMFLEPDAIPLCADWCEKLRAEYQSAGKPFMGAKVQGGDNYPTHMTGVAIYPANSFELAGGMFQAQHAAFDVVGARSGVMEKAHFTQQIIHKFRHPGFTTIGEVEEQTVGATIFHSNKDGSLIRLLRQRKGGGLPEASTRENNPVASVAPHPESNPPVAAKPLLPQAGSMVEEEDEPVITFGSLAHLRCNEVYCYYDPIEGRDQAEAKALIDKWISAWKAEGWKPLVMTPDAARQHPNYEKLLQKFLALPTINRPEYEAASWIRWAAMAVRGGLLVDYDVLPFGLKGIDLVPIRADAKCPTILSTNNPVPCAVYGTKEQYAMAVNTMAATAKDFIADEHGKPHISDQQFVQKNPELFPSVDICKQYGSPGWTDAKLVHFSSHSCRPDGRIATIDKVQQVREFSATRLEVIAETKKPVDPVDEAIERLVRYSQGSAPRKAWVTKKLGAAGLIKVKKGKR